MDALYALAGVTLAGFTFFLVWINWQILKVSRQLLDISVDLLKETIIIREETIIIREVSQVIEQETILTRRALVGDDGTENTTPTHSGRHDLI
tara:strand:+ start:119 stop:397 length:279 start_codon:yes stop_codon:yes gene_type:complete